MDSKQFLDFREARRHSQSQSPRETKEPIGNLHPRFRHWDFLKISGFDR